MYHVKLWSKKFNKDGEKRVMNIFTPDYRFTYAWMRIFLSLIILFSAIMIKKAVTDKKRRGNVELMQWIAIFLAVKDAAFLFLPVSWMHAVSDVLTVSAYYAFTVKNTGEKKIDSFYYRFVLLFYIFIFFYFDSMSQITGNFIYTAFTLLNPLLLGFRLFSNHEYNEPVILKIRIPALTVFIIYTAAVNIFGYESAYINIFAVPAVYLLHLYLLYLNSESEYRSWISTISSMKKEKVSTYDFFKNIGRVMLEKKDIDEINEYIISSISEKTGAESGAVLLYDDYSDKLYISASTGNFIFPCNTDDKIKTDINSFSEFFEKERCIPAETLLDETFRNGSPLFVPDFFKMRHDPLYRENTGNNLLYISSIIIIPLTIEGRTSGMICIEHTTPGRYFTEETFDIAVSLSVYAEIMIAGISVHRELLEKRELDRDITITSGIQKSLLPSRVPYSDKYRFVAYSEPARYVSGDYYDFIKLNSGRIAFLICDVAGKGVAAGLVMTVIRTIVHLVADEDWRTSSVMKMINRGILDIGGDLFATAMFLVFDPETGSLEYSNAAHLPAVLYREASREITYLDTEGLPLGIDRNSEYEWSGTKLERGDILLLYTDGINETMNSEKEQYGRERLNSIIMENCRFTPDEISETLSEDINSFRGNTPPHDDRTFLLLKIAKENSTVISSKNRAVS